MPSAEVKNNPKSANKQIKNKKGCFFIVLCVFVFFIYCGLLYGSNVLLIMGCIGGLFMLLAIIGDSNKIKTSVSDPQDSPIGEETKAFDLSLENQQENLEVSNNRIFYGHISREYFNIVHVYGGKYVEFKNDICANLDFQKQLMNSVQVACDDISLYDPDIQITLILSADLYKIYLEFGHNLDADMKESFCLMYLISWMIGLNNATYETVAEIYTQMFEQVTDYLISVEGFLKDNESSGYTFLMGPLLGNVDRDWEQKYYLLLYRYAFILAKADGMITEKESVFLKHIMQLIKSITSKDESEENTIKGN